MAINFCYDNLGANPALGYPNLAAHGLDKDQFDTTWPQCIPLRLLMYLHRANIHFQTHLVRDAPQGSWYPIALGWHDHSLDYFSLIPHPTIDRIRQRQIKILFYYHEGDNPVVIKKILDAQAMRNKLFPDCYTVVSANTRAHSIDNFIYFSDHEHFFQYINRGQQPMAPEPMPRPYQFTALVRAHKWWRASVISDLWRHNLLCHSLWSYNTAVTIGDQEHDNPIRIHEFADWSSELQHFLKGGPYICDSHDAEQHNDHRLINMSLYQQSYCHLVLETHFDADNSGGTFLTEKTYKCLKYGQPFVMIGPPGSLQVLRQQGYRVFDHALDNSYDQIQDNTDRWLAIRKLITDLSTANMQEWFVSCLDDLHHNQLLFGSRQKKDLLALAEYLDTVG